MITDTKFNYGGNNMSSNQRSEGNNQSNNGGNELPLSSSRAGTIDTGKAPADPALHQSNDVAGGLPKSPGGKHLAADQKMDDDTGLSNTVNQPSADDIDEGTRQVEQSNVGRRSDGTPD